MAHPPAQRGQLMQFTEGGLITAPAHWVNDVSGTDVPLATPHLSPFSSHRPQVPSGTSTQYTGFGQVTSLRSRVGMVCPWGKASGGRGGFVHKQGQLSSPGPCAAGQGEVCAGATCRRTAEHNGARGHSAAVKGGALHPCPQG